MAEKLNIDAYSRSIVTEREIFHKLYQNPKLDYSRVALVDSSRYNQTIDDLYLDLPKLSQLEKLNVDPKEWHEKNQHTWFMPEEYQSFDIVKWLLDQCKNETELQRTAEELLLYADKDLIDLLKYLKYLVDILRANNIVWGVGRGSSVASFVLYLIGVHRVNSISYDLDIKEFLR